jgi:4-hydroxybenzoyl-CoA thioesterase
MRARKTPVRKHVMCTQISCRRIKIEFGHCDPAQIAYYPNLVAWVDQATHHLFEAVGFAVRDLQADRRLQVPVVGLNVKFLSPATWGEEIEIDTQIARWGSKSFDVHHRIMNVTTGETVAEATETRVCIKLDPNHPKHIQGQVIPDDLRAAFNPCDSVAAKG